MRNSWMGHLFVVWILLGIGLRILQLYQGFQL